MGRKAEGSRYERLIERIFLMKHRAGAKTIPFERKDIEPVARALGITLPKNLGDMIHSFRYGTPLARGHPKDGDGRQRVVDRPCREIEVLVRPGHSDSYRAEPQPSRDESAGLYAGRHREVRAHG